MHAIYMYVSEWFDMCLMEWHLLNRDAALSLLMHIAKLHTSTVMRNKDSYNVYVLFMMTQTNVVVVDNFEHIYFCCA